jgi:integration host factor subunit alpha
MKLEKYMAEEEEKKAGALTRSDLVDAVYLEVGLSRNETSTLVESVFSHVVNALVEGESVKIPSFGSFRVRKKKRRIGRNPKTGVEVPIEPRCVLSFKPSHVIKDRINGV